MNEFYKIIQGIVLVILLHGLVFISGAIVVSIASYLQIYFILTALTIAGLGIGVSQLIYIVPVIIKLNRQRQWGLMKGVIIGAVITVLLNGGCWLWVYSAFTPR